METNDTVSEPVNTSSETPDTQSEHAEESSSLLNDDSKTIDDLVEDPSEDEKSEDEEDTKARARSLNAEKIAEAEAIKILTGEKKEEDVPNWIREKAIKIANNVQGVSRDDDRLAEMEKKFQQQIDELRNEKLKHEQEKEKERSKEVISRFLNATKLTANEFDAQYGKTYYSDLARLLKMGHPKSEATKLALAQLRMQMDEEDPEVKTPSAYKIPTSGQRTNRGTTTKLTARQIEIAKKCGVDPKEIY